MPRLCKDKEFRISGELNKIPLHKAHCTTPSDPVHFENEALGPNYWLKPLNALDPRIYYSFDLEDPDGGEVASYKSLMASCRTIREDLKALVPDLVLIFNIPDAYKTWILYTQPP